MNASGATHFHRRDALKQLAALAATAAFFVPGRALGAEEKAAASERITLGHIGCGGRATDLFRSMQGLAAAQSVATADCYANKRQAMAAVCRGTPTPIFANCSRATTLTPW